MTSSKESNFRDLIDLVNSYYTMLVLGNRPKKYANFLVHFRDNSIANKPIEIENSIDGHNYFEAAFLYNLNWWGHLRIIIETGLDITSTIKVTIPPHPDSLPVHIKDKLRNIFDSTWEYKRSRYELSLRTEDYDQLKDCFEDVFKYINRWADDKL